MEITRIEKIGNHYYKREDEFVINGVCGGKARVALELIKKGIDSGVSNFVTCGSRDSRQCEVVAKVCETMGVNSHIFMPSGKDTNIIESISRTSGATIHRTKVGYNNVLIAQSTLYAKENNYFYIPFGLECQLTIDVNMHQVQNIPNHVKRIVVPCGGGMNMIAIIKGLEYYGMIDKEVVGIVVGKNPQDVFKKYNIYATKNDLFGKTNVKYSFNNSQFDYHTKPEKTTIDGIELDEIYEAKCIPFIKDNDLLWIIGKKLQN